MTHSRIPFRRHRFRRAISILLAMHVCGLAADIAYVSRSVVGPDDAIPVRQVDTPSGTASSQMGSVPTALTIPSIGLSTAVDGIGRNSYGTIATPARFDRAYWYTSGPAPGQLGSAVIIGHVDSFRGPAVFYRLRLLRPGDTVQVALADRSMADFVVKAVETVSKQDFPAARVYGSHGDSELQLITCGGSFDTAARSYRSNVIVYTTRVTGVGHTGVTAADDLGAPAPPSPGHH